MKLSLLHIATLVQSIQFLYIFKTFEEKKGPIFIFMFTVIFLLFISQNGDIIGVFMPSGGNSASALVTML